MIRLTIFTLAASLTTAAGDVVHLLDGSQRQGTVQAYDGHALTLSVQVQSGTATTRLPAHIIERVEVVATPEEQAALADPHSENITILKALWARHGVMGGRRGNKAHPVAEALARAISKQGAPNAPEQLAALAQQSARLPGENTVLAAKMKGAQIRLLLQAGRTHEAEQLASGLEKLSSGENEAPELTEAKVLLDLLAAQKSWQALGKLEQEWPKWRQMPEKVEERRQLMNEALNRNLAIVVDHPRLKDLCAQALLGTVQVYVHIGQREEALQRAKEIIDWYPWEPYRTKATEIVALLDPKNDQAPLTP